MFIKKLETGQLLTELTQQFLDERLRLEHLKIVNVFPRSDEDNGRPRGCDRAEGAATFGVAVQLRNNDRTDVNLVCGENPKR